MHNNANYFRNPSTVLFTNLFRQFAYKLDRNYKFMCSFQSSKVILIIRKRNDTIIWGIYGQHSCVSWCERRASLPSPSGVTSRRVSPEDAPGYLRAQVRQLGVWAAQVDQYLHEVRALSFVIIRLASINSTGNICSTYMLAGNTTEQWICVFLVIYFCPVCWKSNIIFYR